MVQGKFALGVLPQYLEADARGTLARSQHGPDQHPLCFGSFCQPAFPSLFQRQVVYGLDSFKPCGRAISGLNGAWDAVRG